MTLAAPLRFGPHNRFELQPLERRLLVDGEPAAVGARAFDLLLELASRPGALRTKHELIDAVWPGVIVEEGNLATQISSLRKILGGEVIATIPGRGYRFTARIDGGTAASGIASTSALPAAQPASHSKLQTNLPAVLPLLLGRADDLTALHDLIAQHRLVSVTGAGGIGKTTVAMHVTAQQQSIYPHGVCWVELATVSDASALPSAIAAAIGVQTGHNDALAGLCAALRPLTMLVTLDNAEQLVDGVADLVQAVLDQAPGLRFVVTTQAPLRLASEAVYQIGPLTVPDRALPASQAQEFSAVALFVDRARRADARWTLTDANAPAVINLCRALDGLALAIELAAARAPMLGLLKLNAAMDHRLRLLTAGVNRMAPARQQTLRAALEWSHGFLDEVERAVFRRLAVFAGSGSLVMVQQVVADDVIDAWAVLDALALLVDRSLVVALTAHETAEPRYKLLETPRAFALERLREAGEENSLRQRHLQAMAELCEAEWQRHWSGEIGFLAWVATFQQDEDNAREAFALATATRQSIAALQIGCTLARLVQSTAASTLLTMAQQCVGQINDTVPAALQVRGWLMASACHWTTQRQRSLEMLRRAVEVVERCQLHRHDPLGAYRTWCWCARAAAIASADQVGIDDGLARARDLEQPDWPAIVRKERAWAEHLAADRTSVQALAACRALTALDLAAGGDGFAVRANLTDVSLAIGDAEAAADEGEVLLAGLHGSRNEHVLAVAITRINVAAACLMLGRLGRARELAQVGWSQARLWLTQPYWADYLALLAALEARPRAAARLTGFADATYAARENRRDINEAAAVARAVDVARTVLGDADFDRLYAEGKLLTDDQIEALAFATEDAA